jgi:hypothetical protein
MAASPTTDASPSRDVVAASRGRSEALALQLLVEKRARQRNLQRDVAARAVKTLAELGNQARAADLDLLVTFLDLAAAEAERECGRWGEVTG